MADNARMDASEAQVASPRVGSRTHAKDASPEERNEMAKAAAPYIHRRRGQIVEGDETEGQTIVIQVMNCGGDDAEALPAPDVIEGEATTVKVERPV